MIGRPKGSQNAGVARPGYAKPPPRFYKCMTRSKTLRCQEVITPSGTQCKREADTVIKFHSKNNAYEPMGFCHRCLYGGPQQDGYNQPDGCHPGEHVHYDIIEQLSQLPLPLTSPQTVQDEAGGLLGRGVVNHA